MEPHQELDAVTKAWLRLGVRRREAVPLARLEVPLSEARIGLVSTGGARLPEQTPFDTGKAGDPSYREIPSDVDPDRLVWEHPHYETALARQDPDVVFPLGLLSRLVSEGSIGGFAGTAVSMMGYAPLTRPLVEETGPAIAELMQGQSVDAVLLCPA